MRSLLLEELAAISAIAVAVECANEDTGKLREQIRDILEKTKNSARQQEMFLRGIALCQPDMAERVEAAIAESLTAMQQELIHERAFLKAERERTAMERSEILRQARAEGIALARQQATLELTRLREEAQREKEHYMTLRQQAQTSYGTAMQMLDDILERAGYSRMNKTAIPSAILGHAATIVAAVCGTNPVGIKSGTQER